MISAVPAGFAGVWLLGLSVGLTACVASCLPFMGTWIMGRGGDGRGALRDTASFLLGKLAAYALLGALAGALGAWLTQALESGVGMVFIGGASVWAGIWLLLPAKRQGCGTRKLPLPPFALGFALSLTPCAPLASLLAVGALSGSAWTGAGYGLAFGLGAAVTPLLLIAPLLGRFGMALREGRPWMGTWLKRGGGAVLIALGLRRLWLLM